MFQDYRVSGGKIAIDAAYYYTLLYIRDTVKFRLCLSLIKKCTFMLCFWAKKC